jgi:hypothetical protein
MKIRTGFISNSSSSSFIVAFNKRPKNIEKLSEIMGECSVYKCGYRLTSKQVVQTVWNDFKGRRPLKQKELFRNFRGLVSWEAYELTEKECPEYNGIWRDNEKYTIEQKRKIIDKFDKLLVNNYNKLIKPLYEKFISENKGKLFYKFDYADEDGGIFAAMEHGDVFRNLPHITISNH